LAALWAEFLKVDPVGLDDNFFELGGHSLLAMQIGFQIRERFNVEFPLEAFLMAPVLKAQSERIEQSLIEQANEGQLELLLGEIEQEDRDVNSGDSPGQNRAGNSA
jgi:phthiocerol/phenolphthiocerol synthesis type-I polyketide synthase E